MVDPLSAFNRLLADAWPSVRRQIQTQANASLKNFQPVDFNSGQLTTRGGSNSLQPSFAGASPPASPQQILEGSAGQVSAVLKKVDVEFKLASPPAYREISEHQIWLAVPAEGAPPWAVKVDGGLDLRALGITVRVWTTLTLSGIRLELPLRLLPPAREGDPRPQTGEIVWENARLELDWHLSNTSDEAIKPRGVEREPLERESLTNRAMREYLREHNKPLTGEMRTKLIRAKKSRFRSLPGLTGWAEVELRLVTAPVPGLQVLGSTSFDSGERAVEPALNSFFPFELDLKGYPRNWGLGWPIDIPGTYALRPEAERIAETTRRLFPFGQVSNLRYRNDTPQAYVGYEDTAIWTGHCLAAHAFQYATLRREKKAQMPALGRIDELLSGIELLFAVTRKLKKPGLLARAAFPDAVKTREEVPPSPSLKAPEIKKNVYGPVELTWNGEKRRFRGYGRGTQPITRDQYLGVLLGLAVTHLLVPEVGCRVRTLVEDILEYCLTHDWGLEIPGDEVVRNTWFHTTEHQLALLCVGDRVSPEKVIRGKTLREHYARARDAEPLLWYPVWTTCFDPIDRYYKFNLAHTSMALLLMLDPTPGYWAAYRMLHHTIRDHQNAYFDLIRVLVADRFVSDDQVGHAALQRAWRETMTKTTETGSGLTLQEEIQRLLGLWLDRRKGVVGPSGVLPTQRTPDGKDLVARFPHQISFYPPGFAKVDETTNALKAKAPTFVSTLPLPVQKRPGKNMDFMWQRDPFTTDLELKSSFGDTVLQQAHSAGGNRQVEAPGVDYLLAYWMAAYLGVAE